MTSATASNTMPKVMTNATGIKLAKGVFVVIDGIVCKKPLNKKNTWMTFFNCKNSETGRKERIVYLVVLT